MPRTVASSAGSLIVGAAIRRARTESNLTQAQLAERTGGSAPYIANVEAGRENLTIGRLSAIAEALGRDLVVDLLEVERFDISLQPGAERQA
jgi:transcriptional regulator with XRE-family HTH domain